MSGPFIPKASLERISTYVGKDPRYNSFEEFEQYIRVVSQTFGPLTDAQWRHLAQTNARQHVDGRWGPIYDPAHWLAIPSHTNDVVLWPYWDQVRCPALLLRGQESDLLLKQTADEMTRRGPRARFVEFPGIGHAPMLMAQRSDRSCERISDERFSAMNGGRAYLPGSGTSLAL